MNLSDKKAVFEDIQIRKKKMKTSEFVDLNWKTRWTLKLVDYYEIFDNARKMIENRKPQKPKWQKILIVVFKLIQSVILIAGGIYAKKLF